MFNPAATPCFELILSGGGLVMRPIDVYADGASRAALRHAAARAHNWAKRSAVQPAVTLVIVIEKNPSFDGVQTTLRGRGV